MRYYATSTVGATIEPVTTTTMSHYYNWNNKCPSHAYHIMRICGKFVENRKVVRVRFGRAGAVCGVRVRARVRSFFLRTAGSALLYDFLS